jgi:S1-C subfamily serine protease
MTTNLRRGGVVAALSLAALVAAAPAGAQQRERVAKDDAALVVDGVVRQVFRSPRQTRTDYLVQIEVQRSEGRRAPKGAVRPAFPAPGDLVYVHLYQRQDSSGKVTPGDGHSAIPAERAQVRAFLTPREQGGWEGTFPDWFDLTSERPAEASAADPTPGAADGPKDRVAVTGLGLTTEPMKVSGRLVLKVTSVERGGPAQKAGLEPGDVIVGAKGVPLTGADQIEELARKEGTVPLVVLDVHTGRLAQVELRAGPKPDGTAVGTTTPKPPEQKPDAAPPRSLGISAETVALGPRTAMKVVRVEPGSPAAKAGIEPNDVLVAANGAAITGPEQLAAALRKSGPTLTLTVRDSRTGRDTPVEVALGGPKPADPLPKDATPPGAGAGKGKLGAVTELAFYDVEAAVKVTEVEPGSPAARAGLQPGILILEANGKAVLHPNDLNDAVRKSGGTLKLTVVDPRSGRNGTVDVSLGG